MSKQKQRWSREEEVALSDGVERYGHGKWKHILSDPQFASTLASRSNIDLKDKWRNLNVSGNGLSAKDRAKTLMKEVINPNPPFNSPEPSTAIVPFEFGGTARPSTSSQGGEASIDYKALILEALSSREDSNGPDLNEILNFIEDKYELPGNFENSVTKKLRRLVLTGEIKKVNKRFKVKGPSSGAGRQPEVVIPITAVPCDTGTLSDDIIPKPVKNRKVNKRFKVKGSSSGAGRQPEVVIPITAVRCDTGTLSDDIIPKPVKNRKVNKRFKVKGSSSGAGRQPEVVITVTAVPCDTGTLPDVIIPKPVKNRNKEEEALEKSVIPVPGETLEDAARFTAHAVAVAERLHHRTIRAYETLNTLQEILEESAVMLAIAKDIHVQCSKNKMVVLKI